MDFVVITFVSLLVSALTLFSGFGLGTLLMPAFALFFPIPVAVAATAVVHLANNVFKVLLVGRSADRGVVLKFALPAALAAFVGAWLLERISAAPPMVQYSIGQRDCEITPVKLMIALLIIGFAVLELSPRFEKLSFNPSYIPLGGILSGFFGGLSGHQGALRTAFLIRSGLSKESFIGTMVVSAVIVDVARLIVYGTGFWRGSLEAVIQPGSNLWWLVLAGSLAAFVGSWMGSRLVKKVTMRQIQILVGVLLLLLGFALGLGLI
jgi:uncharacterized protein